MGHTLEEDCHAAELPQTPSWLPVQVRPHASPSAPGKQYGASAGQRADLTVALRGNGAQMAKSSLPPAPTLDELLPSSIQHQLERFAVLCLLERNVRRELARLNSTLESMRAQCTRLKSLQRVRAFGTTRRRRGKAAGGVRDDEDELESEEDEEEGAARPVSLLLNEAGQQLPSNSDAIYIWTQRHRLQQFGKVPSKAELRAASAAVGAAVASVENPAGEKRKTPPLEICSDPGWTSAVLRWQLDRLKVKRRKTSRNRGKEEGGGSERGAPGPKTQAGGGGSRGCCASWLLPVRSRVGETRQGQQRSSSRC